MSSERIVIEVSSKGAVTVKRDIDQIGEASEKSHKGVDMLRRELMRLVSIGTVTLAFHKFLKATSENERVQAQLAAALRSTNAASGQTIESLNEHAAALQRVTNFGDEAVNGMQSILLTFTNIGEDIFPRATEATADLAERMGMDLNSAALQLGKALNDPVRGLTMLNRAGIQFSKTQTDTIKKLAETNRLAEAQAIILEEVEKQFGGSARAARETLGGALTALGNIWGDLFEVAGPGTEQLRVSIEGLIAVLASDRVIAFADAIGSALFRAFSVIIKTVTIFVDILPSVLNFLDLITLGMFGAFGPEVVTMIGLVLGSMSLLRLAAIPVVMIFEAMVVSARALAVTMAILNAAILANPWVLLIAALVAIVGLIVYFRNELGITDARLKALWETGVAAFNAIWEVITAGWELVEPMVSEFLGLMGDLVVLAGEGLVAALKVLWAVFEPILKAITEALTVIFGLLRDLVGFISKMLGPVIVDVFLGWATIIQTIVDAITSLISLLRTALTMLSQVSSREAANKVTTSSTKTQGFKTGGEFIVPGSGGPDSQLVRFMATPGERVTIETPEQQRQRRERTLSMFDTSTRANPQTGSDRDAGASRTPEYTPPPITIINSVDPRTLVDAVRTAEGQNAIVNAIRLNRDELQLILGVS